MGNMLGNIPIRYKLWIMLVLAVVGMAVIGVTASTQLKQSQFDDRKAKTQNLVQVAHGILAHYGGLAQSGEMSREAAQTAAVAAIKTLRYDENEYFWINDMHPRMVMHPYKPKLDGEDLSGFEDPEGKRLFVAFADTVREKGEGFVDYLWPKPGLDKPVPKISYVKGYEPWGWIVGSGIYVDDVTARFWQTMARLGGIMLAMLLVGGAAAWVLISSITRPIKELEATMEEVAESGNLALRTSVDQNDELGRMARAFNHMLDGVRKVFAELHTSVARLGEASAHLSTITAETRQGMERQHSGTDQVATAMNEMSATVQEVASNSAQAAEAAHAADTEGADGRQVVSTAMDTINGLAQEVERAAEAIDKLEADSEAISKVLDVIRDIAEQTNLLALNAAIEAARAGEQGRGFAVVADEVRTLAQRTQDSTQEIRSMIETLQSGARNAVQVMNGGRERAGESVSQAGRVGESLEKIAAAVTRINDMATQIATATEEQSAVAEEIDRHVTDIAQVADRTADGAVSAAQAARELEGLAENLNTLVARYST